MKKNPITKDKLIELIIGDKPENQFEESLQNDEVKSMLYHQWKDSSDIEKEAAAPDLDHIFNSIKQKVQFGENPELASLTRNLDNEHNRNRLLKRQISIVLSIAAGIIILLGVFGISYSSQVINMGATKFESRAPLGSRSQMSLPDGTSVFLNSGSLIRYSSRFGIKDRNIELIGEAFFEVARNEKLPFKIDAGEIEIEVLGTKFNLMAYPNEDIIKTSVTEGRVSVREQDGPSEVQLSANQYAIYNKETKLVLMKDLEAGYTAEWINNKLVVDNENFDSVIKKLERWYGIEFTINGKDSLEERFTFTVKNESINEVLNLLQMTAPFDYTIDGDNIFLMYD